MMTRTTIILGMLAGFLAADEGALEPTKFVNPIGEGADPWVVRDPRAGEDGYVWCFSEGNRGIALHESPVLTSLGPKRVVWEAPESGPYSREVWAPELHFLDGKWYIYMAASDGRNENHLSYVLESEGEDPLGEYELHGPLATGEGADGASPNLWAIDVTVLSHDDRRYAIWSGWDETGSDRQYLYIAPMKSPTELAGTRVRMCDNDDYPWELTEAGGRGLHEGPQVLKHGERTFVIYSCGASWLPTYKLGLLELVGTDPLDPAAWEKHPEPVFESTSETFGVGHSCFVPSPDGEEWWHVFHAKRDRAAGWRRAVFIQPFEFNESGFPVFGQPVRPGVPLAVPSGGQPEMVGLPFTAPLDEGEAPDGWSYYGHHQFFEARADGLHLGLPPADPVNAYRSGEKLVLDGGWWDDFKVAADVAVIEGGRDAGILCRVSAASVGYDAQRGYFAGIIPAEDRVIFGKTDGEGWTELARVSIPLELGRDYRLEVTAEGDSFTVAIDGRKVLDHQDASYSKGSVGLRVVDSHARFRNLRVEGL